MRICLLAHAGSVHTVRFARYFGERGHDVHVVSLTPGEKDPAYRLHVVGDRDRVSQERTNWHYLLSLPRLRRTVRALRPDLLNAHFLSSNGVLGAIVRPRGCPLVISLLGSDVLVIPGQARWKRSVARWALGRAQLVTSVAEHMTQALRELAPVRAPVLTRVFGVDTEVFGPPDPDEERPPIVLSARRLVRIANVDTILEAARLLESRSSPLRIRISGSGERGAALRASARDLVESGRVEFRDPTPEGLAPLLQEAALYVSMTSSDGASLSLLEAMACGAFPVVSDIPANREWITHGENGFVVPLGSAAELADRLDEAWGRGDLRREARSRNLEIVRERADRRRNMAEIEGAFRSLVAERG